VLDGGGGELFPQEAVELLLVTEVVRHQQ